MYYVGNIEFPAFSIQIRTYEFIRRIINQHVKNKLEIGLILDNLKIKRLNFMYFFVCFRWVIFFEYYFHIGIGKFYE